MMRILKRVGVALAAVSAFGASHSFAQQTPPPTATVCEERYEPRCIVEANGSYHCVYVLVFRECREVQATINPDP